MWFYVYSLKTSWISTYTLCPKYVCFDTAFESSVKSLLSLKICKYIRFLLQQLYSFSVLLIFALRHNAHMFRYCPNTPDDNPLFTYRTTLSPSFFFQSSEDVFMLFSTDCVSGQEETWFHYCFAWMIADYRPLWMRGFLPRFGPSVLQLSPCVPQPNQQKMVMAVTPHCPLPAWKPATEKLHPITAAGHCWAAFAYSD